jgi:hypothetical protein
MTQFFLTVLMVIAIHTASHHNKSCVHLLWERVKHCCKKSDVENIGSLSGSLLIFFCFHPHDMSREPHVSSMAKVAIHFTWSPKCFSDHIDGFCFVLYTFMLPVYMWVSGNKNCGSVYDLFVCAFGRIILIFYCLEGQDVK